MSLRGGAHAAGGAIGAAAPEPRRLPPAVLAAGTALLVLHLLGLHGQLIFGYDQAQYVVLGEALAEGEGYRQIQVLQAPRFTRAPPGLPAVFAAIHAFAGTNLWLMNAAVVALGLASLVLAYRFLQPLAGGPAAAAAVGMTGANAVFYTLAHQTLTEVPYLFASLAALLAVRHACRSAHAGSVVLAAALTAAACYTRTIGVVLIPAGAVFFLATSPNRRAAAGRALLYAGVVAALVLPWLLFTATAEDRNYSYYDVLAADGLEPKLRGHWWIRSLDQSVNSLGNLLFLYSRAHTFVELPAGGGFVAGAIAGALVVAGLARGLVDRGRRPHVLALAVYLALYLAAFLVWRPAGLRTFVPVLPFVLLAAGWGLAGAARALRLRPRLVIGAVALASLLPNVGAIGYFLLWGDGSTHAGTLTHATAPPVEFLRGPARDYWRAAEWIGARSAAGAVAAARTNQVFYLASGRRSVFLTPDAVASAATDYVLVDAMPAIGWEAELLRELKHSPGSDWTPAARFGETLVLRRVGAGASASPQAGGGPRTTAGEAGT